MLRDIALLCKSGERLPFLSGQPEGWTPTCARRAHVAGQSENSTLIYGARTMGAIYGDLRRVVHTKPLYYAVAGVDIEECADESYFRSFCDRVGVPDHGFMAFDQRRGRTAGCGFRWPQVVARRTGFL
jgi:hypothetical protein